MSSISSRIDPSTRSILTRISVSNKNFDIIPGQLMTVKIIYNEINQIGVPESAVTIHGNTSFVYIVKDDIAEKGIEALRSEVDSLITIPIQKLTDVFGVDCDFTEAFAHGNDVLLGAVRGISDIITSVGTVNVDFQDVKTVMSEQGTAMMGTGIASGHSRALDATTDAIGSPLLEDISLQNAKGILVNMTGGEKVTIGEIEKILEQVNEFAAEGVQIIHGVAIDKTMNKDDLKVTIVATGLGDGKKKSSFGSDTLGIRDSSVPSINSVKPINDLQEIETEASLDYLDVPSFVKRQID